MTKNKDDENYQFITFMMEAIGYLPIILLFSVGPLVIVLYPMTFNYIKQTLNVNTTDVKSIHYLWRMAYIRALYCVSMSLNGGLFTITFNSFLYFIKYSNEILDEADINNRLPIMQFMVLVYFFVIGCIVIIAIGISIHKRNIITSTAISIAISFTHIGCYFLPYMILAFIHNPLQTTSVYTMGLVYLACSYAGYLSGCFTSVLFFVISRNGFASCFTKFHYKLWACVLGSWSLSTSATLFIVILNHAILKMGSFDDFQGVQNLLLPLLIGVFTLFVIKPAYNYVTAKLHDKSEERCVTESTQGEDLSNAVNTRYETVV